METTTEAAAGERPVPRTSGVTVIFLLHGVSSFPNPGNWNPVNNKIECLGSGYQGQPATAGGPGVMERDVPGQLTARNPGGGGGGGGYAFVTASNPTFPVNVYIAIKNQLGFSNVASTSVNTSWNFATSSVYAEAQAYCGDYAPAASGTLGGGGGNFSYTAPAGGTGGGYAGGTGGGGSGVSGAATGAGSGGGAAGPHGAGGTGATGGAGGAGDGGTTPPSSQNGTQWDASHGCGSGGASGTSTTAGGNGGNYGAGAGGQAGDTTYPIAGTGSDGLMVITYTPRKPYYNFATAMS